MEQTVKVIGEIDEVVRLIPQERIQQRTVEQKVIVAVPQVVKEMGKNQSVSSTETLMRQLRYRDKYQQSGRFRRQWRFFYKCSP